MLRKGLSTCPLGLYVSSRTSSPSSPTSPSSVARTTSAISASKAIAIASALLSSPAAAVAVPTSA